MKGCIQAHWIFQTVFLPAHEEINGLIKKEVTQNKVLYEKVSPQGPFPLFGGPPYHF